MSEPQIILGSAYTRSASITLNDDQIKTLPSHAFEVVCAPGDGRVILPLVGVFYMDTTNGAYNSPSANTSLSFQIGNRVWLGYIQAFADALTNARESYTQIPLDVQPVTSGDFSGTVKRRVFNLADVGNQPLYVQDYYDPGSDYTGGDSRNVMVVSVRYSIFDCAAGVFI